MRITFNDNSGKLIKAPKLNTIEARLMADQGWNVIQTTKSGHAIWVKKGVDFVSDFPNVKGPFIEAKAYVSSDRVLTHIAQSSATYRVLWCDGVAKYIAETLNIGYEKGKNLNTLFSDGAEFMRKLYRTKGIYYPMTTDISPFVSSMNTAREEVQKGQKPEAKAIQIIHAFN